MFLSRLDDLMKERGWSDYRLAQNSKLSSSTIANIRSRNTVPSVVTLESICNAFGITLAQFFADNQTMVHLTPEQKAMFDCMGCSHTRSEEYSLQYYL